jgi:choice-of-anchor C domain-containing protein
MPVAGPVTRRRGSGFNLAGLPASASAFTSLGSTIVNRILRHTLAAAASGALLASGAAAAGNLIVNGSFESGPSFAGPFVDLPGGSTAITGWTVGDFHIDYNKPATWNASDGSFTVDLDGSVISPPKNGSISQSFATVAGKQYVVTFDLSANPAGLPLVKQAEVSAGNAVQVHSFNIGSVVPPVLPLAITYQHETFLFTAVSATTTLKFKSLTPTSGSPPGYGPIIDNVVVESVPATWTDLGFALPGIAGAPRLDGTGSLIAGTPGALTLSSAKPSAPALLFIALGAAPSPFVCGTLVPVPALSTLAFSTSPAGGIPLAWPSWPSGLSGLALHFQYAVKDAAAPCGVALSNALRGRIP